MPSADQLKAADQAAQAQSAGRRADDSVQACPKEERYAIEVTVVGEDDEPLADIGVELRKSAGAVLRDKTGVGGMVRFDGLQPGSFELGLHELDQDAWELKSASSLAPGAAASSGDAAWQPPAPPAARPTSHSVEQGDSISSIAQRYGYLPDSLWAAGENADLKRRRENRDILNPGDVVALPAPREKRIAAQAKQAYRLMRKGVPTTVSFRFVDSAMAPRANLPWTCDVENARGQALKQRSGSTDGDGVARIPVPLDATRARLALSVDGQDEVHVFELGHMNPADTDSGVQSRLVNLRYLRIDPDGDIAADTRSALLRFQHDHGLRESGELDAATVAALRDAHSS